MSTTDKIFGISKTPTEITNLMTNYFQKNDLIRIDFEFITFKNKNSFDLSLSFVVKFLRLDYKIDLILNNEPIINLKKLYHQQLTKQEIEEISNQAGKMVLDYIKSQYKNDEVKHW